MSNSISSLFTQHHPVINVKQELFRQINCLHFFSRQDTFKNTLNGFILSRTECCLILRASLSDDGHGQKRDVRDGQSERLLYL